MICALSRSTAEQMLIVYDSLHICQQLRMRHLVSTTNQTFSYHAISLFYQVLFYKKSNMSSSQSKMDASERNVTS